MCVCVLGLGRGTGREGKTWERLCAWEPDLFCFWFHWGERESESEWYHHIVVVFVFNAASRLGVYLWGCFGPQCTALGFLYLVHWFRHSQSRSQSNLHVQSEWLIFVAQASSAGDSERVRGGTICPGSCSHAPPHQVCVRMAVLLLWALSGRFLLHSPV